jgi:hypothetical protein
VSDKIDKLIRSVVSADLVQLMSIWQAHDLKEWSRAPEIYRALGERILGQGEPLLAYDVISIHAPPLKGKIDLNSSRGNARLILRHWNKDRTWIFRAGRGAGTGWF